MQVSCTASLSSLETYVKEPILSFIQMENNVRLFNSLKLGEWQSGTGITIIKKPSGFFQVFVGLNLRYRTKIR